MAITSDYANLYVANQGNNPVVHFTIADNGVLTQKDSVTLATTPVSMAVNSASTYLYVVSREPPPPRSRNMPSAAAPSAPRPSTVSLTLPGYPGDTIVPTGVTVLANSDAVYVTAYDKSAYNPGRNHNQQRQSRLDLRLRGGLQRRTDRCLRTAPTRPASSPPRWPPIPPTALSMSPTSPPTS